MNIFGIGGAELILILIIMLVVAGPKRMILWSRTLGYYVGKFRVMWSEMVDLVQKEFDEAGMDVKLPKEPPTRQSITDMVKQAARPVSEPIKSSLDEVKSEMDAMKPTNLIKEERAQATRPANEPPSQPPSTQKDSFGTWGESSQQPEKTQNGSSGSGFGTWSSYADDKE